MAKLTLFSELEQIPLESSWFKAYRLPEPCGAIALYEPYHFQEVISFIIFGRDRAILLDTGMGMGNIKATVEALTDKPLTVVNTHSHFDHVGDNWRFDSVCLLNRPESVELLTRGYSLQPGDDNLEKHSYYYPGQLWFDYSKIEIKPSRITPIEPGHIFDLGGRTLRVIATPGHTNDSLMLVDEQAKVLFTGDTIYPAPLYVHFTGQSDIEIYRDTAHRLAEQFSDYTMVCSHNNPVWEGAVLNDIAKAFDEVYEIKKNVKEVRQYDYENFSILV